MRFNRLFLALLTGASLLFSMGVGLSAMEEHPISIGEEMVVEEAPPVSVSLVAEDESIQPGKPFWVAVHLKADEGWHLYWKNPGDSGAPPRINWNLPEGFVAGDPLWPTPQQFKLLGFTGIGYENSLVLLTRITPPKQLPASQVTLKANVSWVACFQQCVPGSPTVSLDLPVSSKDPSHSASTSSFFQEARGKLPSSEMTASATVKEQTLEIALPIKSHLNEVLFLPEKEGVVELNEAQVLKQLPNGYVLSVPLAEQLEGDDQLAGLLILGSGEKAEAHLLQVKIQTPSILKQDDGELKKLTAGLLSTSSSVTQTGTKISQALQHQEPEVEVSTVLWAILAAFGGGLLLNLMPCVLPVLSLKVLAVVQSAGDSRKERIKHGMAYFAGVMLSFWVLAGLLLILRASGAEVGWGFQLQEPIFVGVLACMLFVMALNLYGVFEFGTSFSAIGGKKFKSSATLGALWSGVLATIVATPCTGPFLGASLGFAMALPPWGGFALFSVMAIGMAIPFVLLTISPPLLKILPKPGQWMVVLKQFMGFLLMASVLWLVWVWEAQTNFTAVMYLLAALFILSLGCWIYGNWGSMIRSRTSRYIALLIALGSMSGAVWMITDASRFSELAMVESTSSPGQLMQASDQKNPFNKKWMAFSPELLKSLRDDNRAVFIDFTAKWCLICQANKAILHSQSVDQAFADAGIVTMVADWTKGDERITQMLRQMKRSGVPLYLLYYPGSDRPEIFPETLTPDMLIAAAKRVKNSTPTN